jgi:thioredoxin 1
VDELATEYEGKAVVCKCNVDECDDVPMNYNIRSIPTLLFFKNGEVVDRHVGAGSKADLAAKIEANL